MPRTNHCRRPRAPISTSASRPGWTSAAWIWSSARDRRLPLEQAARYKAELGGRTRSSTARASRAARAVGLRALARLMRRRRPRFAPPRSHLLPEDDQRGLALRIELGVALHISAELIEAERLLEETARIAAASGNSTCTCSPELEHLSARSSRRTSPPPASIDGDREERHPLVRSCGRRAALARAWRYVSDDYWASCRGRSDVTPSSGRSSTRAGPATHPRKRRSPSTSESA